MKDETIQLEITFDWSDIESFQKSLNLNSSQLAEECGYSRVHMNAFRSGKYPVPDSVMKKLEILARQRMGAITKSIDVLGQRRRSKSSDEK